LLDGDARVKPKISISICIDSEVAKIGAKQIAFLEAVQTQGSISGAGRSMGLSYPGTRLLIGRINNALCEPAVNAEKGGRKGGGAALTPVGEQLVRLYREIELRAHSVTVLERRAFLRLVRPTND
jgi:molybdate transport system regulatory protein